ncbi:MAG: redoxin domain-containing protein [Bacteroidales bacterium]|nr:redoxin domain-containing protein [Bacteroidales bacterium]
MKRILFIALLILSSSIISGSEIKLNGYAPGGAGKYIELYDQPDPITGQSDLIERIKIPDNDTFSFRLDCHDVCWLRLRYGVYEILLVVKEGSYYDLNLPYYSEKTKAEKLNPFFKYELIHINLSGGDNINNRLKYIDSLFFNYRNRISRSIYLGEQLIDKDSLLQSFANIKESLTEEYTYIYHEYRYCLLRMIANKQLIPGSNDLALINKRFLPDMPAYTDLVNQVFNGYLNRLVNDRQTSSLRGYINSGGPNDKMVNLIQEDGIIRDISLIEFMILLNLYSEYYGGRFKKEGVEKIFGWMANHAVNKYNRNLAGIITEKINRLKPGNMPPGFSLKDTQGKIYTLDSLRGKHAILAFVNTELPETKYELDILSNWTGEYKDKLAVVVILLDEDFESSLDRLGTDNYDFIFLDGSESNGLFKDYEIRYLPAFYFLNRELRLVLSPAVLPSENLKSLVILQLSDGLMDNI